MHLASRLATAGLILLGSSASGLIRGDTAVPAEPEVVAPDRAEAVPGGEQGPGRPRGVSRRNATSARLAVPFGAMLANLTTFELAPAVQAAAPSFVYRPGAQGFGYYAAPAPRAANVQAAPSARPRTVGPSARNWATGNRVPLHRPWLRSRN